PSLLYIVLIQHPHSSTLFPYTTLFRSKCRRPKVRSAGKRLFRNSERDSKDTSMAVYTVHEPPMRADEASPDPDRFVFVRDGFYRSEEHTSELQSRGHLVCRLLLEKKQA